MSPRPHPARHALGLLAARAVADEIEVPYLSGRVNDEAEVLRPETRQAMAARLQQHEARTGAQVVVLTVRSLGGASIEDYAMAVFEAWKLGRRGQDDGVLLVVAPSERRMRIEVGYGLEGTLPDIAAGRIIRNVITPRFQRATSTGRRGRRRRDRRPARRARRVAGRRCRPVHRRGEGQRQVRVRAGPWAFTERILLGAFIFGIIGLFTFVGVLTPGMGWFLYVFLIPFWAMFPMVVVGSRGALVLLGTYVVGFPIAKVIVSPQALV